MSSIGIPRPRVYITCSNLTFVCACSKVPPFSDTEAETFHSADWIGVSLRSLGPDDVRVFSCPEYDHWERPLITILSASGQRVAPFATPASKGAVLLRALNSESMVSMSFNFMDSSLDPVFNLGPAASREMLLSQNQALSHGARRKLTRVDRHRNVSRFEIAVLVELRASLRQSSLSR